MQIYKSVCISIALLISILRMYVVSHVIFHCWNPHCFSPLSVLILFRILLATIFILSHFPWDHLVFMHQYGSFHPYDRGMATITDFNSIGMMYLTLYISFKKWVMVWIQHSLRELDLPSIAILFHPGYFPILSLDWLLLLLLLANRWSSPFVSRTVFWSFVNVNFANLLCPSHTLSRVQLSFKTACSFIFFFVQLIYLNYTFVLYFIWWIGSSLVSAGITDGALPLSPRLLFVHLSM